jgi:hypothetical protein
MKRLTIVRTTGMSPSARIALKQLDEHFKTSISKKYISKYIAELQYPFEKDSPLIQKFVDYATNLDQDIVCRFIPSVYFSTSEINKLPFYQMLPVHPFELVGKDPQDYGTQYMGNHCTQCQFGGRLVGDLLVDRKHMKKVNIGSFYSHYFINETLIPILENSGLTGISYIGDVKDYKGREMSSFKLFDANILPPLSKTTGLKLLEYPCGHCGYYRTHLFGPLEYERKKFEGALDFNFSNEIIDNFMQRQLVVSAKVKQVFRENKIHAIFRPIVILD